MARRAFWDTFVHSYRIPTNDGEYRFGDAGSFTFAAPKGGVVGGDFDEWLGG